jgi:succinate dehydrogenase/fumarate reductase flavoprotein subunit
VPAPVVVVGSGAAGLCAALAARARGADVVVVESAPAVGGTTALSGGVVWAPGHGVGPGAGRDADEDRAAARRYLLALATGDVVVELIDAFLAGAARVVAAVAEATPIEWEALAHWPDYRGELPGAASGGRSIWPRPLVLSPAVAAIVQDDPATAAVPAAGAVEEGQPASDAVVLRGPVRGRALVGALLHGILDAGVEVRTGWRAQRLLQRDGVVSGVESATGEQLAGRVVLASGGFQFDAGSVTAFLGGAPLAPLGTPGCRGDGLRMAQEVGAALGNMAEAWWMPAMAVPGETIEGVPFFRSLHSERAQPGAVLVDRAGRRFVDEAQNYGDVGRAMRRFATGPDPFPAAPSWLVFGAGYRARYPVGPLQPGDADPPWLVRADDVAELARATGMPPSALAETLERFDAAAAKGDDPDFGRGRHPYDRWIGDAGAPHPTLAPVGDGPLYALPAHAGCLGTKGGPRTDGAGRVLGPAGTAVPGLYAAGNAAASPFGTATAAGGATLGPALIFGYLAGEAAALDG